MATLVIDKFSFTNFEIYTFSFLALTIINKTMIMIKKNEQVFMKWLCPND
jgi:hypothetical protein